VRRCARRVVRDRRAGRARTGAAGRRGGLDPDRARSGGIPRRGTASHAGAADFEWMPARVLVQPDVKHVRAQRRHAVPRLPVARRELPDRVDLLADVAHVRRGRVLRSLS
jgi:hypothetical protein